MDRTTEATGASRDELPSAVDVFDEIVDRLEAGTPAVFLDYDGVLSPIVAHPDLAVMTDSMRAAIAALTSTVTVAVVSGRDTSDVRSKVGLDGVICAGSHGFDIVGPDGDQIGDIERFTPFLHPLEAAAGTIEAEIGSFPGAHVERKRFAIAVHFRQADPAVEPELEALVRLVADRYPQLEVTGGKKIFELRPAVEWDKGRALEWLVRELGLTGTGVVPIYLGDDVTDEDAFRVIRDSGIGIVVGVDGPPTLARYHLEDTEAVETFLTRLHRRMVS
jgi:alpha,alpha-trehalase